MPIICNISRRGNRQLCGGRHRHMLRWDRIWIGGGRWAVESDPVHAAELMLAHIESKRDALGINKEVERKLYDMEERRTLSVD